MEEEIRRQAILRNLQGEKPKAIYTNLNRSKKWFFKWFKRYKAGLDDWYKNKSKAPVKRPRQTGTDERELIITIRKKLESESFAQIGVSAIKWELHKLGMYLPSDSTIKRILKKEGLVKKNNLRCQGSRISLFQRGSVYQQHSSGRSCWSSVYQEGWQVLFTQHFGCIQSSGVH